MAYANPLIMNHLKDFINSLKRLDHIRVLDVAMGQAHVTKEILLNSFKEIDMFDKEKDPVDMALEL